MNFLAHFHLAAPAEHLILGGLEGDFFKGPLSGCTDPDLLKGIRLHRAIDAFTDQHPAVTGLRRQFPAPLRRFAGILTDLSFDHFLSRHWSLYSSSSLTDFNRDVYHVLDRQQRILSPEARHMAQLILDYDMLGSGKNWDAVAVGAARIGRRFRRGNPLADCGKQLDSMRSELENSFLGFYPDLIEFSRHMISRDSLRSSARL